MRETVAWLQNFFSKKRGGRIVFISPRKREEGRKTKPRVTFSFGGETITKPRALLVVVSKNCQEMLSFSSPQKEQLTLTLLTSLRRRRPLISPQKKRKKIEGKKLLFLFPSVAISHILPRKKEGKAEMKLLRDRPSIAGWVGLGKRIDSFYKFHGNFITKKNYKLWKKINYLSLWSFDKLELFITWHSSCSLFPGNFRKSIPSSLVLGVYRDIGIEVLIAHFSFPPKNLFHCGLNRFLSMLPPVFFRGGNRIFVLGIYCLSF